jgi:hypothetical protein
MHAAFDSRIDLGLILSLEYSCPPVGFEVKSKSNLLLNLLVILRSPRSPSVGMDLSMIVVKIACTCTQRKCDYIRGAPRPRSSDDRRDRSDFQRRALQRVVRLSKEEQAVPVVVRWTALPTRWHEVYFGALLLWRRMEAAGRVPTGAQAISPKHADAGCSLNGPTSAACTAGLGQPDVTGSGCNALVVTTKSAAMCPVSDTKSAKPDGRDESISKDGVNVFDVRDASQQQRSSMCARPVRRAWRQCVVCDELFNRNSSVEATLKTNYLSERAEAPSNVPEGVCDVCIPSYNEANWRRLQRWRRTNMAALPIRMSPRTPLIDDDA